MRKIALAGANILILSDEPVVDEHLSSIVADMGGDVSHASTIESARHAVLTTAVSGVIIDLTRYDESLTQFVTVLATRKVPVFVRTASALEQNLLSRHPGSIVILKPGCSIALASKLANAIAAFE